MNKLIVRCKDCKHWELMDTQRGVGFGRCAKEDPEIEFGETRDRFGVVYGEPYNEGIFVSGPEFACIHGERK